MKTSFFPILETASSNTSLWSWILIFILTISVIFPFMVPSAFKAVIALGSLIVLILFSRTNQSEILVVIQPLSISAIVSKLSLVSRVSRNICTSISRCPFASIHLGSFIFLRYHNASSSRRSFIFCINVSFISS
jgi:hypothetical protein